MGAEQDKPGWRREGQHMVFDLSRLDDNLQRIAAAIAAAGGRAVLVGGFVRDALLAVGADSKDLDVEVFGLDLEALQTVLDRFGAVISIGRSFGVLRLKGLAIDFSLPRRDNKVGAGHRGFVVEVDSGLDFAAAARRRDLTINSMGVDLQHGRLMDPHGGRQDLQDKVLRPVDDGTFAEDPLRALRAAQFAARFDMRPHPSLVHLCSGLDLSELSAERLGEEFRKLLLKGVRPSVGLEFLRQTGLIRFFPQIEALIDVPQDPRWHPEGDVWRHTMMCVDAMAEQRRQRVARGVFDPGTELTLALAVLCHDFGKASHTTVDAADGRVRSQGHDKAGVAPARDFLAGLRISTEQQDKVSVLVAEHLAPALYMQSGAGPRGFRRLARRLGAVGLSMQDLESVARADNLGRTTAEALAGAFAAGDAFLEEARRLAVDSRPPTDVVLGRHLIARGKKPGPAFSLILQECRELQDSEGLNHSDQILDRVLGIQPTEER